MPAFPRAYSEVITHEQIMSQAMEGRNYISIKKVYPPEKKHGNGKSPVLVGDTSLNGLVFSLSC